MGAASDAADRIRRLPVLASNRVTRAARRGSVCLALLLGASAVHAAPPPPPRIPVLVDLDIGDDIDDSFALALVLASPAFELVGVSTAWGDTALRVRLVQRLLGEIGRPEIPVRAGVATPSTTAFTQARWASGPHRQDEPTAPAPAAASGESIDFLLAQASARPGEITLLALGPLTNLAAALHRDPAAFGRFKQIVLMGGSLREGYRTSDYAAPRPPDREYNIVSDVAAAQAVFTSGVPIVMMPLDATAIRLDDQKRAAIFSHGSALTDALTLMVAQWTNGGQPWSSATPTLFDVVPVAWLLQPGLCPTVAAAVVVEADGRTREGDGAPNVRVCLRSDKVGVLDLLMGVLLR